MFIGWVHYIVDKLKNEISTQDTIIEINGIINDIKKHSDDCVENLKELLQELSEETGYCPKCSSEMHYRSWKEDRGECRGFPAEETVGEMYCEECGYTY
jgi:hypothetical protein